MCEKDRDVSRRFVISGTEIPIEEKVSARVKRKIVLICFTTDKNDSTASSRGNRVYGV